MKVVKACVLVFTLLCSGCGSGLYTMDFSDSNRTSKVCLVRKNGLSGTAASVPVLIDQMKLADIGTGQRFCADVPSGIHSLQADRATVALNFSPELAYYFSMEDSLESGLRINTIDASTYEKILKAESYEDIDGKSR